MKITKKCTLAALVVACFSAISAFGVKLHVTNKTGYKVMFVGNRPENSSDAPAVLKKIKNGNSKTFNGAEIGEWVFIFAENEGQARMAGGDVYRFEITDESKLDSGIKTGFKKVIKVKVGGYGMGVTEVSQLDGNPPLLKGFKIINVSQNS